MRCGVVAVNRPDGELEKARRTYKWVKNGKGASDLDLAEFGALYLYYPELLPDVEVER